MAFPGRGSRCNKHSFIFLKNKRANWEFFCAGTLKGTLVLIAFLMRIQTMPAFEY